MFVEYTAEEKKQLIEVGKRSKKHIDGNPKKIDIGKLDIKTLKNMGAIKRFDEGEVICRENEVGYEMYLILQGTVSVVVSGKEVATLDTGSFFGEMSLLDGLPRSATIISNGDLIVLSIGTANFEKIITMEPTLAVKIMTTLSKRVRLQNELIVTLSEEEEV
jgi:CRP-like cAMP-binding protein